MKHSPGKWEVAVWTYEGGTRHELNIQNESNLIAKIECDFTGDNPYQIPKAEAFANAKLFSAAPRMLAELKRIAEYLDYNGEGMESAQVKNFVNSIEREDNTHEIGN